MLPFLQGVYMSEGIAALVAGVITSIVYHIPESFCKARSRSKGAETTCGQSGVTEINRYLHQKDRYDL